MGTPQAPDSIQSPAINALAGAAAGAISKTAVAPIERVKLLMQLKSHITINNKLSAWEVAQRIYREEGFISFWRGNMANIWRQGATSGLNFMLMDQYKLVFKKIVTNKKMTSFVSGGLAGATATTVIYPFEFLRTRLAMDTGLKDKRRYPRGMIDLFSKIIISDGYRGLYQGYGIALSGVVVYRALHLGGYDIIKYELAKHRNLTDIQHLTFLQRFIAAQIVSIVAGTACYPIDSVRRRLMMQSGIPLKERYYKHSIDCFRKVYANEGFRGFYLGLGPNLLRSFGGAIVLVAYDSFKGIIYV